MSKWGRVVLAVVVGSITWGILWNLGTRVGQVALPTLLVPERPIEHIAVLVGLIVYSILLSILAGFLTAWVAGMGAIPAIWSLAILQLSLGVVFEVSYWGLMPVWYHLVFLALVVPATVFGGVIRSGRQQDLVG